MADVSITASSVQPGSDSVTEYGTAGATIAAGEEVYLDAATNRYLLADADSPTVAARQPRGMALNSASDGQPLTVHKVGDVTVGAVLTAGAEYYLSDTPGKICPRADLTSGDFICLVGIAKSTSVLKHVVAYSGVSA